MSQMMTWRTSIDPDVPAECAVLKSQIVELQDEVAGLQQELHQGSGNKAAIIREIVEDEGEIADLAAERRRLGCDPPPPKLLALTIPKQEQSYWCWVAVGSGIASFYDATTYAQCAVVTLVFQTIAAPFPYNCCVVDASQPPCNGESGADQALDHPRHHFAGHAAPLGWSDVVAQIDQGRPVAAEIGWAGGGAHFVAITGYSPSLGLYIQDPAADPSWCPIAAFTTSYQGTGTWISTTLSQP